jgi:hypothetical protein
LFSSQAVEGAGVAVEALESAVVEDAVNAEHVDIVTEDDVVLAGLSA